MAGMKLPTAESAFYERAIRKARRKKKIYKYGIVVGTIICAIFALLFTLPIILTITNSFMTSSEISANYGVVFQTTDSGGKVFIAKTVNLKFIPDMVSFSQYFKVLFMSPEYLLKFWNSMIYVVPILIVQLSIAMLASYGFARYKGRVREIIFFLYIIMIYTY